MKDANVDYNEDFDPGLQVYNGKTITINAGDNNISGWITVGWSDYTAWTKDKTKGLDNGALIINANTPDKLTDDKDNNVCMEVSSKGNLTINGGYYTSKNGLQMDTQSFVTNYGVINIDRGAFSGSFYNLQGRMNFGKENATNNDIIVDGGVTNYGGTTNMYGGKYVANNTYYSSVHVLNTQYGSAIIENCDMTGKINIASSQVTLDKNNKLQGLINIDFELIIGSTLSIKDGAYSNGTSIYIINNSDMAGVNVTGGKFYYHDPSSWVTDTDKMVVKDTADWYYVKPLSEAWIVGTGNVGTLTDMINTATSGQTIKLMKIVEAKLIEDSTKYKSYALASGQTLDINGKTLACNQMNAAAGMIMDTATSKGLVMTSRDGLLVEATNGDPDPNWGGYYGRGYIPLYDSNAGGYKLFRYAFRSTALKIPSGKSKYRSQVMIYIDHGGTFGKCNFNYNSEAYSLMENNSTESGLKFFTDVNLDGGDNTRLYYNVNGDGFKNLDMISAYGKCQYKYEGPKGMTSYYDVKNTSGASKTLNVRTTIRNESCGFELTKLQSVEVPSSGTTNTGA